MNLKENIMKAIREAKMSGKKRNFKQGMELMVSLKNVDLRKTEERIAVDVLLPHGLGKHRRVVFFADGELARQAREAGAELVLSRAELEELGKDLKRTKKLAREYDVFLAQTELMPVIGRLLGRVLGPRDKMPKPVPSNVNPKPIIERYRRVITLRTRDQPAIRTKIGDEAMSDEQLAENALSVIEAIEQKLPKGMAQIRVMYIKTTMGKPVRVEVRG